MTYAPTNPVDVPPYQIQHLISTVVDNFASESGRPTTVRCAQALGSEIYVGCSNGELIRFALQADNPDKLESYRVLSRQMVPNGKPVDEIVIVPSLSRALVLSDRQIHFYTIPSLDPVPQNIIKPIRHVVTFAVDHQHLKRPPPSPSSSTMAAEPVEFSVVKRSAIAMYSLRERLFYDKEIPLPDGATLARRTGRSMCIADRTNYNVVDLENASLFPILPLSQAMDGTDTVIKPSITIINDNEFLILSWTGASTLGVFITSEGDPVRGTLQWPSHPLAVCLDYPYITTLLPNEIVEIHNVETQEIVQAIGAPISSSRPSSPSGGTPLPERLNMMTSISGYLVPSTQKSEKMRKVPVLLNRGSALIG